MHSDDQFFASFGAAPDAGLPQDQPQAQFGMAAQAIGAVGSAISGTVNAIAGAAVSGTAQQAQPDIMAKTHVTRLQKALAGLKRCRTDLRKMAEKHNGAVAWLQHPNHKKRWTTQSHTPAPGTLLCPTLWDNPPGLPAKIQPESPGGHVFGEIFCRCPTDPCAYKGRVAGLVLGKKLEATTTRAKMEGIKHGGHGRLPGDVNVPLAAKTGSIDYFRMEALRSWSFLLSLEVFRDLIFLTSGYPVPWRSASFVDPVTLKYLFSPLYSGDEVANASWGDPAAAASAEEGRVPAHIGSEILAQAINFYAQGLLHTGYTPPIWVYNFNRQERENYVVGPTIGQIAAVQANWQPDGSSLMERLRTDIASGAIRSIPEVQPGALPGARVATAPVLSAEQQAILSATARPESWWTPMRTVGVVIGGTLAASATAILALVIGSDRKHRRT